MKEAQSAYEAKHGIAPHEAGLSLEAAVVFECEMYRLARNTTPQDNMANRSMKLYNTLLYLRDVYAEQSEE